MSRVHSIFLVSTVLVFFVPTILSAQQTPGRSGFSVVVSEANFLGSEYADSKIHPWYSLQYTHKFTRLLTVEFLAGVGIDEPRDRTKEGLATYFSTEPGNPYRTHIYPLYANLRLTPWTGRFAQPYVVGGFGEVITDLRKNVGKGPPVPVLAYGDDQTVHGANILKMADIGVGTEFFLSEHLGCDISLRYGRFFYQSRDMSGRGDRNTGVVEARFGLSYLFGPAVDRDEDGIPDKHDDCPTEPEDIDCFADDDGCPDPDNDQDGIPDGQDQAPDQAEDRDGYQDEDGRPDPDNDSDGIPDDLDQAPGEAEDFDGFQDDDSRPDPDNDGDGIPDIRDRCPNQPETVNDYQDEDGCPDTIPKAVEPAFDSAPLLALHYGIGVTELNAAQQQALDVIVHQLRQNASWQIAVKGYADNIGDSAINRRISQQRAQNVTAYLVRNGVSRDRIQETRGYGELPPDQPEAQGQPQDRRVDVILVKI